MAQIELNAFADYALITFDYSAEYEDDAWSMEWSGAKVYVERRRSHFLVHVGAERHQLPR